MKSLILNILHFVAWVGLAWILIAALKHQKEMPVTALVIEIQNPSQQVHLIEVDNIREFVLSNLEDSLQNYLLAELPLGMLNEKLNNHPYLKSASIFVSKSAVVKVECTPRNPVARVIPARGESYYIDREGAVMPLSDDINLRLAVIRGRVPQKSSDSESDLLKLHRLGELFSELEKSPFLGTLVDQLVVTALDEYVIIPSLGTEKIELGQWERMQEKLWDLEVFYTEIIAEVGWGKYEKISLKYDGQVVGTRKTTATP